MRSPASSNSSLTLGGIIRADLYRYRGRCDLLAFVRSYLFTAGFKYSVWFRLTHWYGLRDGIRSKIGYYLCLAVLRRLSRIYGIQIPPRSTIGPGLLISHFGAIVINEAVVLGRNCNLSHEVTLGQANRGVRKGCPVIGDKRLHRTRSEDNWRSVRRRSRRGWR